MIYTIGAVSTKSTDLDKLVLTDGDAAILTGGVTPYSRTIEPKHNCAVFGDGRITLVPRASGRNMNGLRIVSGQSSITVAKLNFDTSPADPTSAVSCSGTDCVVRDIRQVGVGKILQFDGAIRLLAWNLFGTKALRDKGIYAGGPNPSVDCRIWNFEIPVPPRNTPRQGSRTRNPGA